MDRPSIKAYLLKLYKKKVKPDVLEKNIEGLVDEYIDTQKFIIENGVDVDSLPNKTQMKYWFQEALSDEVLKAMDTTKENIYEIKIDDIYIRINPDNTSKKDKIAEAIYKRLYNYEWKYNAVLPEELKDILKIYKLFLNTKNPQHRKLIENKLINYAFLGTIRFYHIEAMPYLRAKEIETIGRSFRTLLDVIYKSESGFYEDCEIKGSVYMFDTLGKRTKTDISNTVSTTPAISANEIVVPKNKKTPKSKKVDINDEPQ